MKSRTIDIITLGCSKNLVDSEKLIHQLELGGYSVTHDSDNPEGEIAIVNTCGFIGDAKEESIDTILGFVKRKQEGKLRRLIVMGCLSERYRKELQDELPEVDCFYGKFDWEQIVADLGQTFHAEEMTKRRLTTPAHYAYLKISEGCNRHCAYCAIPLIRGRHVSVPMEELEEEARKLAEKGVKELILIAQDSTYYGIDLYGKRLLGELLRRLCKVEGIEWIRLHYAYPAAFPEEVIEVMATEKKICHYLDIPFQHISDNQLSAMLRRHTKAEAVALIQKLRARIPDLTLRTTMLVGYPGETEADFEELCDFVREVRFERLGVFPYSEEEGTHSAEKLTDDVPEEVKQARVDRLMAIQQRVSAELNRERVGRTMRVVVDGRQGDFYVARSEYDSPEVDQEILIPADGKRLFKGRFYDVMITDAEDYDLYGELMR